MAGRIAYYGGIVTNGLVLALDAAKKDSYPGSGTVWRDISGNGNNGTLTNGPTFNSGNGGSIVFDGVDDYVLCNPISTSLNANVGATLGLWCKVSVGETQAILLSYLTLNTNNGFRLQVYNGSLTFTLGAVADYSTGINISDNTWKYITSTSSGNTTRVYINGVLRSTITMGTMVGVTLDTYILAKNGHANTYYLNGTIGQVQSYNRALTAQEVSQNFNATRARFGI